jgi:hypothetical protein
MKNSISAVRIAVLIACVVTYISGDAALAQATTESDSVADKPRSARLRAKQASFMESLRKGFLKAAKRFDLGIDTKSIVTSMHTTGFLAVATIPSTSKADALLYFSFPQSACGQNALPSAFYKIETVKDPNTGTLTGVRHLDERGKEIITVPLDTTISHSHHHTTGSKIVTGSDQDPSAAVSVFAWYNTGDDNTHIEYDLTNGQCCPFPGCG